MCLGHTIAELVEIPIFTWLFFELLLIFVWVFIRSASHNAGFVFWVCLGFLSGPGLAFVLHAKVRSIVQIHCAEEIRKSLNAQTRRHSIKVYGATTQQRLHEDYPSNFWFGKQTKAGFTLNLVRIIVLCQSVYCAVLMVVFAEQMFESPGHCKAAQAAMLCDTSDATGLVYLALCLVPPFMTISKLPRILEDFTIASNIDSMVNNRMLSNVNRRQKTVAAFEALKVVQCLSDTQMLRQVIDGGSSTGDADCRAKLADREARLAALEELRAGNESAVRSLLRVEVEGSELRVSDCAWRGAGGPDVDEGGGLLVTGKPGMLYPNMKEAMPLSCIHFLQIQPHTSKT